jgi:hypothetical protein
LPRRILWRHLIRFSYIHSKLKKFITLTRRHFLFGLKYSFPTHLRPKIWLILVHPKIQKLSWIQKYVYSHGQRKTHHLVLSNKQIQTFSHPPKRMCSWNKEHFRKTFTHPPKRMCSWKQHFRKIINPLTQVVEIKKSSTVSKYSTNKIP